MMDPLVVTVCLVLGGFVLGGGCFVLGFYLALWLFRGEPLPRKTYHPVSAQDDGIGGWYEADGSIWCGLCDWKGQARTMEHMEAIITDHMKTHGLIPLSRIDLGTGEETEFPMEGEDAPSEE